MPVCNCPRRSARWRKSTSHQHQQRIGETHGLCWFPCFPRPVPWNPIDPNVQVPVPQPGSSFPFSGLTSSPKGRQKRALPRRILLPAGVCLLLCSNSPAFSAPFSVDFPAPLIGSPCATSKSTIPLFVEPADENCGGAAHGALQGAWQWWKR